MIIMIKEMNIRNLNGKSMEVEIFAVTLLNLDTKYKEIDTFLFSMDLSTKPRPLDIVAKVPQKIHCTNVNLWDFVGHACAYSMALHVE